MEKLKPDVSILRSELRNIQNLIDQQVVLCGLLLRLIK